MLPYHEEIVSECEGCARILKRVVGDKKLICSCHPYPHIQWIGGLICPQATHYEHSEYKD